MMILNIKEVSYYDCNIEILKEISFEVNKGDCISIIGQSGSGKSTLLKLCADLLPISSGQVFYNGKDYKEYNPLELRKKICYCTQLPYLFGHKVRENLEFPFNIRKEPVNIEKIIELLKKFDLSEEIIHMDINRLSGGEKQRLAIIRSLIYVPEIILLDEATASLDENNTRKVEEYIKELNNLGVTVLWVTHSIEQSERIFNKRITISDGKIESVEVLR